MELTLKVGRQKQKAMELTSLFHPVLFGRLNGLGGRDGDVPSWCRQTRLLPKVLA